MMTNNDDASKKDLTSDWESLTISEQSEYGSRAYYLIENGYVLDTDVEELAKKIYYNERNCNG